jgi:hypothetical protein
MQMTQDDANDAMQALHAWFISQDIGPKEAAVVCAMYSGSIIGVVTKKKKYLNRLVRHLNLILRATAEEWFLLKDDGKKNETRTNTG